MPYICLERMRRNYRDVVYAVHLSGTGGGETSLNTGS